MELARVHRLWGRKRSRAWMGYLRYSLGRITMSVEPPAPQLFKKQPAFICGGTACFQPRSCQYDLFMPHGGQEMGWWCKSPSS